MESLSQKERLLRVLRKRQVDRPPVICPGGMMNAAIVEVMEKTGYTLPEAHHDPLLMASLAGAVHELTGFENLGVPFCMTVEAEVLGSKIDFGTLSCEPKIAREAFPSVAGVVYRDTGELLSKGRIGTVAQAVRLLSRRYPGVPVIGNLTGPISTAASLVDPMRFLKELRKDREHTHKVITYVSELLSAYAGLLIDNGVTVIAIEDPTATGEILGPRLFAEYAVGYLNHLVERIHARGVPVIVHICGKLRSVEALLPRIQADAISTDAMVSLPRLKERYPQLTVMGNLSTYLLQFGEPERVAGQAARLVRSGVEIISPACGLSTSTSLENIRALTGAVRDNQAEEFKGVIPGQVLGSLR